MVSGIGFKIAIILGALVIFGIISGLCWGIYALVRTIRKHPHSQTRGAGTHPHPTPVKISRRLLRQAKIPFQPIDWRN